MIPGTNRFHGHNSLNYVYRHGKTVRGPLFALKYAPNRNRQTYRLAVVVSKKISKAAVDRNRIRRRIYEVVRHQAGGISQPYDMVITVFSDVLIALPADELDRAVRAQLKQAAII
jgi:ribonuclease P protein component